MDRKYSTAETYNNSINSDDAPDGSDGGYTRHGSYITPEAMKELVMLREQLAEALELLKLAAVPDIQYGEEHNWSERRDALFGGE